MTTIAQTARFMRRFYDIAGDGVLDHSAALQTNQSAGEKQPGARAVCSQVPDGNKRVPMLTHSTELTPDRILDFIDRHFTKPITPRDVASAMHYSLCHLTHVARKTLGASVSDLILARRIAAAQHLLAESTLPVSAVARQVGFADNAYFSRRFSRATGASPSAWRKLHRKPSVRVRCHACGTILPQASRH